MFANINNGFHQLYEFIIYHSCFDSAAISTATFYLYVAEVRTPVCTIVCSRN